jgi:hypothetical protein
MVIVVWQMDFSGILVIGQGFAKDIESKNERNLVAIMNSSH